MAALNSPNRKHQSKPEIHLSSPLFSPPPTPDRLTTVNASRDSSDFCISSHPGKALHCGGEWDAGGAREHAPPARACSVARAVPRSFSGELRPTRTAVRLLRERQEVKRPRRATAAAETRAEGALRPRRRQLRQPKELRAAGTRRLGSRILNRAGWIITSRGLAATRW